MKPASSPLDAQIAAALAIYDGNRKALELLLAEQFLDAEATVGPLLDATDEFGIDHAVELLREKPDRFGAPKSAPHDVSRVVDILECLATVRDQLDALCASRYAETRAADPSQMPRIFIQGTEYVVDAVAGRVWKFADPSSCFDVQVVDRNPDSLEARRLLARQRDLQSLRNAKLNGRDRDR